MERVTQITRTIEDGMGQTSFVAEFWGTSILAARPTNIRGGLGPGAPPQIDARDQYSTRQQSSNRHVSYKPNMREINSNDIRVSFNPAD
jgi:hypothetical protein